MGRDSVVGRRVVCLDGVKGTVISELPDLLVVKRDDNAQAGYPLDALVFVQPKTHLIDVDGGTRLGQLVTEFAKLADSAKRYEQLKKQIKDALTDAVQGLDVAWEDGDSVDMRMGQTLNQPGAIGQVVRAYTMSRTAVDIERLKEEYPEGYRYFLKESRSLALKLLTA